MKAWQREEDLLLGGVRPSAGNERERCKSSEEKDFIQGMALWRRRHAFFFKCVSIILTFLFLHQQIGWAQEGKPVWAQARPAGDVYSQKINLNGIEIPYDVAKTDEVAMNGGDDVIIHIQDAHASLSAQYSIANLLDSLVTNYDLRFIALEGASGFIDTSMLKTFPDKEIRDDTANFLMREGRMSAGEFFQITNDGPDVTLYGVESDALYRTNIESFRKVAGERAEHAADIEALLYQLSCLEDRICSEDLRVLNRNSVLHREGRMSFTDHWAFLDGMIKKHGIDIKNYRELAKILKTLELEKDINFARANLERRKLIDTLSGEMYKDELEELVLKSLAFKQNKLSQAEFHKYLVDVAERSGIPASGYGNLISFTRYVTIYESVELVRLYAEMEELENSLREKLYRNRDEREVYRIGRMVRLLKQLYTMELNNQEFKFLNEHYSELTAAECASFIGEKCRRYNAPVEGGYDLGMIFGDVEEALEFYLDAEARNNALLANTISEMRREGKRVAALITGGYHTEGLTDLMRRKKLSYLVVIPKFEAGKERPYVAILTNKKKPYEKLLESGRYQLAVEAYFQDRENKIDTILPGLFHAMGEAVIQNRDEGAIVRLWQRAYEERYNSLLKTMGEAAMAGKVTPAEFADFLSRVDVQKINQAAVISYSTDMGTSFIALAKSGNFYEFDAVSRSQREIFLARADREKKRKAARGLTGEEESAEEFMDALDELKTDVADIKAMLRTFIANREEALKVLDEAAPGIAADIASRFTAEEIADENALREEAVSKLRAKGLPQEWQSDEGFRERVDKVLTLAREAEKKEAEEPAAPEVKRLKPAERRDFFKTRMDAGAVLTVRQAQELLEKEYAERGSFAYNTIYRDLKALADGGLVNVSKFGIRNYYYGKAMTLDDVRGQLVAKGAIEPEKKEAPEPVKVAAAPAPVEAPVEEVQLPTEAEVAAAEADPVGAAAMRFAALDENIDRLLWRRAEVAGRLSAAERDLKQAAESEDAGAIYKARGIAEEVREEARKLEEDVEARISPVDQFYYGVVQEYDRWLAELRLKKTEPTVKVKVEKLFAVMEKDLVYWISRDYGFDSLEMLTGKRLEALRDFALKTILEREKAPARPEDIRVIKALIDSQLSGFFMPGAEGQRENMRRVKERMLQYFGDERMPFIRDFLVLGLLTKPDPQVPGARVPYQEDINERFARVAPEVTELSVRMADIMADLAFLDFQVEYLQYRYDTEKTDELKEMLADAEDESNDKAADLSALQNELIEVLTSDAAFPELRDLSDTVTPMKRMMRFMGRQMMFAALGTLLIGGAAGCSTTTQYVHNRAPAVLTTIQAELPKEEERGPEAVQAPEEEKAAEPELIRAPPREPTPLDGRVTITRMARAPPGQEVEPSGTVELERWHGGRTFQQAFRGGESPGDVITDPFMMLESKSSRVVFPKAEDMFDPGEKTGRGAYRWQFLGERPGGLFGFLRSTPEVISRNEAGDLVDGDGAPLTRARVIEMIRSGEVKNIRDNRRGITYGVSRPELVWVGRREATEKEKEELGEDMIPAQVFGFDSMTEYQYRRGVAYMENGDHVKAFQMFEEAMKRAADVVGVPDEQRDAFDQAVNSGDYKEALEIIETNYGKYPGTKPESSLESAREAAKTLGQMQSQVGKYMEFLTRRFQQVNLAVPDEEAAKYMPYLHEAIETMTDLREELSFNEMMRALGDAQESGRAVVLRRDIPYRNRAIDPMQTLDKSKLLQEGATIYVGDEKGTKGIFVSFYSGGITVGVKYKALVTDAAVFSHITRGITAQDEVPIVFLPTEKGGEDMWDTLRITGKHLLFFVPNPVVTPIVTGAESLYEGTVVQGQVDDVLAAMPGGDAQADRNLQVFDAEEEGRVTLSGTGEFRYPGFSANALATSGIEQAVPARLLAQIQGHRTPVEGLEGVPLNTLEVEAQERIVDSLAVSIIGHPIFAEPGDGSEVSPVIAEQRARIRGLIAGTAPDGRKVEPAAVEDVVTAFFDSRDWENASYTVLRKDGRRTTYLMNRVIWNVFRGRGAMPRSAKSLDGTDNMVMIPVYEPGDDVPHHFKAMIEEHYDADGKLEEVKIQESSAEGAGSQIREIRLPGGAVRHVVTTPERVDADDGSFVYKQVTFENGDFSAMSLIEVQRGLEDGRTRTVQRLFSVDPITGFHSLARAYVTVENLEGEMVYSYTVDPSPGRLDVIEEEGRLRGTISLNLPGESQADSTYMGELEMTPDGAIVGSGAITVMSSLDITEPAALEGYSVPSGSKIFMKRSEDGERLTELTVTGPARPGMRREMQVSFAADEGGSIVFDAAAGTVSGHDNVREMVESMEVRGEARVPEGSYNMAEGSRLLRINSYDIVEGERVPKELELAVHNPDGTRNVTYLVRPENNEVHIIEGEQLRDKQVGVGDVKVTEGGGVEFSGRLQQKHEPVSGSILFDRGAAEPERIDLPGVSETARDVFAGSSVTYTYAEDGATIDGIAFYSPMDPETGSPGHLIASFTRAEGRELAFDAEDMSVTGYNRAVISAGHADVGGDEAKFRGEDVRLTPGSTMDTLQVYGADGTLTSTVRDIKDPLRGRIIYTVEEDQPGRVFVGYERAGRELPQEETWAGSVEGADIDGGRVALAETIEDNVYKLYTRDESLLKKAGEKPELAGRCFVRNILQEVPYLEVAGVKAAGDGTLDTSGEVTVAKFEIKDGMIAAKDLAQPDENGNIRFEYDTTAEPGETMGRMVRMVKTGGESENIDYYGDSTHIRSKQYVNADGGTELTAVYAYTYGTDEATGRRTEEMVYEFNDRIDEVREGHCIVYRNDWEILGARKGVRIDSATGRVLDQGTSVSFEEFIGEDLAGIVFAGPVPTESMSKDAFYSILYWMKGLADLDPRARASVIANAMALRTRAISDYALTQAEPGEDILARDFNLQTREGGDIIGTLLYWGGLHGKGDLDFDEFSERFSEIAEMPGVKKYLRTASEFEWWTPEKKLYSFLDVVGRLAEKSIRLELADEEIEAGIEAQIRVKRGERVDIVMRDLDTRIQNWRLFRVIKRAAVMSGAAFTAFLLLAFIFRRMVSRPRREAGEEPGEVRVPRDFVPQQMLLEAHEEVNRDIAALRRQERYRTLSGEEKDRIVGALEARQDIPGLDDNVLLNYLKMFDIFLYDTGARETFTTGQTTHIGMSTRSIHITKAEYERLRQLGRESGVPGGEDLYVAARVAHEMAEMITLLDHYDSEAEDRTEDIRSWIRRRLRRRAGPEGEEYATPGPARSLIQASVNAHLRALILERDILPEGQAKDDIEEEIETTTAYLSFLEDEDAAMPVLADINIAAGLNAPPAGTQAEPAAAGQRPVYDFDAASGRMKNLEGNIEKAFWDAHYKLEPIYYDQAKGKVKPAKLTRWYTAPSLIAGTGFIAENIVKVIETGMMMGWGWDVWAFGILFIFAGLYSSRNLIRDALTGKKARLARQREALEVLEPAVNGAIEEMERLMDEGGDGFTGDQWRRMLTFSVPSRFAHPDDVIAQATMEINLYDYMKYTREWIDFLRLPENQDGDYLMYSRFHTPKHDVQRNLPTFFLRGKSFTSVLRDNEYNRFVELMPGERQPVPLDVPFNGQRFYRTSMGKSPVHPAPLTNLTGLAFRAADRINEVRSFFIETGDLDDALGVERVERSYRMRGFVDQARGYGGVGPARSSYARGAERHGFRLKSLVASLLILGALAFFLRVALTQLIPIPQVPALNAGISIFITFFAAMTGYMVNTMIEKMTLFGLSFTKRAETETITDRDMARFIPPGIMMQALEEILGREGYRRRVGNIVTALARERAITADEADAVLTAVSDREYQRMPAAVSERLVMELSKEVKGRRGRRRIWKGEFPSKWPVNRLRLEYPMTEAVYLANKTDRASLVAVIMNDGRLSNRFTPEERHKIMESLEAPRERRLNDDILSKLNLDDMNYLVGQYGSDLLPKVILMDTTFGQGAGNKLVSMINSLKKAYSRPIDVFPVMDDNDRMEAKVDREAFLGIVERLAGEGRIQIDAGRLAGYRSDESILAEDMLDEIEEAGEGQAITVLEAYREEEGDIITGFLGGVDEIYFLIGGEMLNMIPRLVRYGIELRAYRGEMHAAGTLADYAGNIEVITGADFMTNYAKYQRKLRMKPPMNAEAVKKISLYYERKGEKQPDFMELVDEEDRLTPLLLRSKAAVWEMRERTILEQENGIVDNEDAERWRIDREADRSKISGEYMEVIENICPKVGLDPKDGGALRRFAARPGEEMRRLIQRRPGQSDADLAKNRMEYMLWAFLSVFPPEVGDDGEALPSEKFLSSEFRIRNVPTVMQAELRQVPVKNPDWEDMGYMDYLIWHSTIQVGQTVAGFLFLGGTGNGFLWEMLAYTRPRLGEDGEVEEDVPLSVRAEMQELMRPLREAIRTDETRREEEVKRLGFWQRVRRRIALMISPDLHIKEPSAALMANITKYNVSGAWDAMNQIEDAELGSRLALYNLKATRLVGKYTQVLEDLLPKTGPGWWAQRVRWITLQAFWAILSYGPAFWMFFGQYVGMGSMWTLIGSRNLMVAWGGLGSIAGLGLSYLGFFASGWAFYRFGKFLFNLRTRAGLERNEQWQVDPMSTMGWKKFQHMSHLSSGSLAGVFTGITLLIPIIYMAALVIAGFTPLQQMGGTGLLLFSRTHMLKGLVPILMGWLVSTMVGVIVFVNPPFIQSMMGWITTWTKAIEDEEATTEGLRMRIEDEQFRKLKGLGQVRIEDYTDVDEILRLLDEYESALVNLQRILDAREGMETVREEITRGEESGMPFAYAMYRDLGLPSADPSRENMETFRRAITEIRAEVENIRRDTSGAIFIRPGVGIAGVLMLAGTLLLSVNGWLQVWATTMLIIISGTLVALKAADLYSRNALNRPLFTVGRLPLHMLRYFVRIPIMIHYYNNMVIPSFQNMQRSFFPGYSSEGYWTRGRTSVVKFLIGQKITLRDRIRQRWAWVRNQGPIFLFLLVLPYIGILGLNSFQHLLERKMARERAPIEWTIEDYVDGKLALTGGDMERIINEERSRRGDVRGYMRAIMDRYEYAFTNGMDAEAARMLNLLVIYAENLRNHYLDEGGSEWDYEYFTEYAQQAFARMGRLDEYYELFDIDVENVVPVSTNNASFGMQSGGPAAGYTIRPDGAIALDVDLPGRAIAGGAPNMTQMSVTMNEPVNMRDDLEFVFEVFLPEEARENLAGHVINIRAFDEDGNPKPLLTRPGYEGGQESKLELVDRKENPQARAALLGKWVSIRIKPEVPAVSRFNPERVKVFLIEVDGDLIGPTSGKVIIRNMRIAPRPSLTLPVGQRYFAERVTPLEEFRPAVGSNIRGSFHDVGSWGGKHDGYSSPAGRARLKAELTGRAEAGASLVRIQSFFGDARAGMVFDAEGAFTRFDEKVEADVKAFFEVLEEVRREYPGLKVMPVLFSYQVADGSDMEGDVFIGESPRLFSDPVWRARLLEELDRVFGVYWGNEGVYAWDLFNEPESSRAPGILEYIKEYVRSLAGDIHARGGKVLVGSRNERSAAENWAGVDEVDILGMQVYDKGVPLLNRHARHISSKPVLIIEWGVRDITGRGTKATPRQVGMLLENARRLGYAGALVWEDEEYGMEEDSSIEDWTRGMLPEYPGHEAYIENMMIEMTIAEIFGEIDENLEDISADMEGKDLAGSRADIDFTRLALRRLEVEAAKAVSEGWEAEEFALEVEDRFALLERRQEELEELMMPEPLEQYSFDSMIMEFEKELAAYRSADPDFDGLYMDIIEGAGVEVVFVNRDRGFPAEYRIVGGNNGVIYIDVPQFSSGREMVSAMAEELFHASQFDGLVRRTAWIPTNFLRSYFRVLIHDVLVAVRGRAFYEKPAFEYAQVKVRRDLGLEERDRWEDLERYYRGRRALDWTAAVMLSLPLAFLAWMVNFARKRYRRIPRLLRKAAAYMRSSRDDKEKHPIDWTSSLGASAGYALAAAGAAGLAAVMAVSAQYLLIATVSLSIVSAIYLAQYADLRFGFIAGLNEFFRRALPARAGPPADRLIRPFRPDMVNVFPLPAGSDEIAYVAGGKLFVNAREMSRRPAFVQYFYFAHEWLHLKGIRNHFLLYLTQGAAMALLAGVLLNSVFVSLSSAAMSLAGMGMMAERARERDPLEGISVSSFEEAEEIIVKDLKAKRGLYEDYLNILPEDLSRVEPVTEDFARACFKSGFTDMHVMEFKDDLPALREEIIDMWLAFLRVKRAIESGEMPDNVLDLPAEEQGKHYLAAVNADKMTVVVVMPAEEGEEREEKEEELTQLVVATKDIAGSDALMYDKLREAGVYLRHPYSMTYDVGKGSKEKVTLAVYQLQEEPAEEGGERTALSPGKMDRLLAGLGAVDFTEEKMTLAAAERWEREALRLLQQECSSNSIPGGVWNGIMYDLSGVMGRDVHEEELLKYRLKQDTAAAEQVHAQSYVRALINKLRHDMATGNAVKRAVTEPTLMMLDPGIRHLFDFEVKPGEEGPYCAAFQVYRKYDSEFRDYYMGPDRGKQIRTSLMRLVRGLDSGFRIERGEIQAERKKLLNCLNNAKVKKRFRNAAEFELAEKIISEALKTIQEEGYTARFSLWKWLQDNYPASLADERTGPGALAEKVISDITLEIELAEFRLEDLEELIERAEKEDREVIVVMRDFIDENLMLEGLVEKYGIKTFVSCKGGFTEHIAVDATILGAQVFMGLPETYFNENIETGKPAAMYYSETELKGYFTTDTESSRAREEVLPEVMAARALKEFYDKREERALAMRQLATTLDGLEMPVYGNVNLPLDLEADEFGRQEEGALGKVRSVYSRGGNGIALARTEYMFDEEAPPSFARQMGIYRGIADLADKQVTLRTYDKRDDKECRSLPDVKDKKTRRNTYSFDYYRTEPGREALKTQLKAMLVAYAGSKYGNIRVMFPMVKTVDDMAYIREVMDEAKNEVIERKEEYFSRQDLRQIQQLVREGEIDDKIMAVMDGMPTGIMVEDKEAVANLDEILDNRSFKISFMSIGTNDLMSSVHGKPRDKLKDSHFDDKIMRIMEQVVSAASERGITASICGDIARHDKAILFGLYLFKTYGVPLVPGIPSNLIPKVKTAIEFTNAEGCVLMFEGWDTLAPEIKNTAIDNAVQSQSRVRVDRIKEERYERPEDKKYEFDHIYKNMLRSVLGPSYEFPGEVVPAFVQSFIHEDGQINTSVDRDLYPKDIGTRGTGTQVTREKLEKIVRRQVFDIRETPEGRVFSENRENGRYIKLTVSASGELDVEYAAEKARKDDESIEKFRKRLRELNSDGNFSYFIRKNPHLLDKLEIYLLDAEPGTRESRHPHLLTTDGEEWQVSLSGTRGGRVQVVYLTRAFFEDMPVDDVMLLLNQQIIRAALIYQFWKRHPAGTRYEEAYPSGEHAVRFQRLLDDLQTAGDGIITGELESVKTHDLAMAEQEEEMPEEPAEPVALPEAAPEEVAVAAAPAAPEVPAAPGIGDEEKVMARAKLSVLDPDGVHARPSAVIIKQRSAGDGVDLVIEEAVAMLEGEQVAEHRDVKVDTIMRLMTLYLGVGSEMTIRVEGKKVDVDNFLKAVESGEDLEGVFDMERLEMKRLAVPDEVRDLMAQYPVFIGVPDRVFMRLGEGRIEEIGGKYGVILVRIPEADKDTMIERLRAKTGDAKCVAALLDIGEDAVGEVEEVIRDFAGKAKRDIIELMHPQVSGLTEDNVKRIKDLEELQNVASILVRLMPDVESLEISEKSIYDLRVDNIYQTYRLDYTRGETGKLFEKLKKGETRRQERQFMVTAVDNAADLRLLADSIRDRRAAMKLAPGEEDPVKDVVLVMNPEINKDLDAFLEETGLGRYIDASRVIPIDRPVTPEKAFDLLRGTEVGKDAVMKQVAVDAKIGTVDIESPGAKDVLRLDREDRMLLVQMEDGLVSQMYRMTLEIIANKDEMPAVEIDGRLDKEAGYNIFHYLPKVEPMDMREIQDYQDRIMEIMIRA